MIEELKDPKDIAFLEETFPNVWKKGSIVENQKQNPESFYWIYKEDGQVLGCINYAIFFERMELVDLYVVETNWNRGIGTMLLEKMQREAEKRNIESITLEVSVENERALHLYQKMGFVKVAIRKGYYQGIDAWLLEREMGSK